MKKLWYLFCLNCLSAPRRYKNHSNLELRKRLQIVEQDIQDITIKQNEFNKELYNERTIRDVDYICATIDAQVDELNPLLKERDDISKTLKYRNW